MKFKKSLVLLTAAVMTLGAFSGCSLGSNKPKDLSVNAWGKPVEVFDYVVAVKKGVEKQGYTAEMEEYGDGMYELSCYKAEFLDGVDISFYDGKIDNITYKHNISNPEEVDGNIQEFKNHVTEYSEMLDKVSKNTSLELWPVNDIYSNPAYFEIYREDTDRSSYVYNGRFDFSFFNNEYSKTMSFRVNLDDSGVSAKGFYDEDESTDTSDDDSDSDIDEDDTDTSDSKADSYEGFKEKMNEVFDEGYSTDSTSVPDEFNVFEVALIDKPNNQMLFDVADDGTINRIGYEYEIPSEISDDDILDAINTFISDISNKALESGYDMPLLTSGLDESALEEYFEDKSVFYEYELEDEEAVFTYYPASDSVEYASVELVIGTEED